MERMPLLAVPRQVHVVESDLAESTTSETFQAESERIRTRRLKEKGVIL